jgi:hypothetical protein
MMAGVRLSSKTNLETVFKELDTFVEGITVTAVPRAVNKLLDQADVAGRRALAEEYGIPVREINAYIRKLYSRVPSGAARAELQAFGPGLPLILFSPIPSRPAVGGRQRGKGVSVRIKGRRFFVKGGFVQRMPNGHVGVFARGAYRGKMTRHPFIAAGATGFGAFEYGKGRLSINELYTVSVGVAFRSRAVEDAMNKRIDQQAFNVLRQEIRFASRSK